jgi:hypothetical protein
VLADLSGLRGTVRARALGPHLFHTGKGAAELVDPLGFIPADELDAPGKSLAPAPGDTGIDEGVENLAL